jgi:hypothetical protein
MNIGLLGFDDSIAKLVAASRRAGDQVVVAADPAAGAVAACSPGADPPRPVPWEALLDRDTCDVVFVGADGWHDGRAEGRPRDRRRRCHPAALPR